MWKNQGHLMPEDYLEKITVPSEQAVVIVSDKDGMLRRFTLTGCKVVLRYVNADNESYTYHPENIKATNKYNSHPDDKIELAVISPETITLEVLSDEI
jgi:hypothetical protein